MGRYVQSSRWIAALCGALLVPELASAGDTKTYPGSFCHTNVIDDFDKNYSQSLFGYYFHLSEAPAVLCPVVRDVGTDAAGLSKVVVWISAPGQGSVGCGVYLMSAVTGAIIAQGSQGVEFGPEGGVKPIRFSMLHAPPGDPGTEDEGTIGLACGVPQGFAIIGYRVEELE
jgi:hypothetical protein